MKARTSKETAGARAPDAGIARDTRASVRKVTIGANEDGQRIDNFLITELKGVPKSHIYRVLRKGEVRVNKGRVKAHYRLQAGDEVRIPPLRTAPETIPAIPPARLAELTRAILYEDADLVVLDKPSGWAVHGGSGVAYGVIEALRLARPDLPNIELVHRLDRETSGCLLLAKQRAALLALHDALRDGTVDKHYLALVKGRWPSSLRRVDVALRKNVLRSGERMVAGDDEDGKHAESEFHVRNAYRQSSMVDVRLLTGRTHQIRVHAAHAGYPLAGDTKYGDEEFNKLMKSFGLRRLFLHAHSVAVDSPSTGKRLEFKAPLPEDLAAVLKQLEQR